jgi:hypothetical protein
MGSVRVCAKNAPKATIGSFGSVYPWPIVADDFWCGDGVHTTTLASFAPVISPAVVAGGNQCSLCVFSRTAPSDSGMGSVLTCNKNAPEATINSQPLVYPWPIVANDFWCGDGADATSLASYGNYQIPLLPQQTSTWTPTITSKTGTLTNVIATGQQFWQVGSGAGSLILFSIGIEVISNGTGAGAINFTLPTTPGNISCVVAGQNYTQGKGLAGTQTGAHQTPVAVTYYDGTYPITNNGDVLLIFGLYSSNA